MSTPNEPTPAPTGPASAAPARLRYRLITGPDDRVFCERVSAALDEGYVLHGTPALTFDGQSVIAGQAVVLPQVPAAETRQA